MLHFANYLQEWKEPVRFDWRRVLVCLLGALLLTPLVILLDAEGYEWRAFDEASVLGYPPWFYPVVSPLTMWPWRIGLALLLSLTLVTVALFSASEARGHGLASQSGAAVLALLTPPVYMMLREGNPAGLVLFGLATMPFGIPYALVQPHLSAWALLARRSWTLAGLAFGVLSLLIWGWWPREMLGETGLSVLHPISLGWGSMGMALVVVGIVMLLFTNADPLRLMAAGVFLTPYLMPVHMLVLLPAIGRVKGWRRLVLWACAWFTLLPSMFITDWAKFACMLFPLAVWWLLRPVPEEASNPQESKFSWGNWRGRPAAGSSQRDVPQSVVTLDSMPD